MKHNDTKRNNEMRDTVFAARTHSGFCGRLLRTLLLLMVTVGATGAWGQTGTNYSGTYFIKSASVNQNTSGDYYLCPTEGWIYYVATNTFTETPNGQPFLTTYQCMSDEDYDVRKAVWEIEKNGNYYTIRHALDGKYIVYNGQISDANLGRIRVHLEDVVIPTQDGNELFVIGTNTAGKIVISPKNESANYFNVCQGNINSLAGSTEWVKKAKNDGPTTPTDHKTDIHGTIGFWNDKNDPNAPFELEPAPSITPAPTITNNFDGTITITGTGTIYYTTNGDDPTTSSSTYSSAITLTDDITVIKAMAKDGSSYESLVATYEIPVCEDPVISFDYTTSLVSITCATAGSPIHYTTGGETPTASDPEYSSSISVTSTTTIKAIAIKSGYVSSTVKELTISQVATPTIQDNGHNAISITTTPPDATIYYTTDGSTPTTSSTVYNSPLTENVSNVTIKAIAVKENMITSAVGSGSVILQCATPVITRDGMTFTLSCSMPTNANLYYKLDDGSEVAYNGPVSFTSDQLPMTVTAVARHSDYTQSETASMELLNGTGTPADPYLIYGATDYTDFVTNVNNGSTSSAHYKLCTDVSASGISAITTAFTGTFDGGMHTISGLGHALFNTVDGGVVKNVILDNVSISGGTNVGAIANKVTGTSSKMGSIYNCGVLSGSISGSGYVGSIVGQLGDSNNDNCYARVINCFSYATVSGGSNVGGIVGYNDYATTAADIRTMVMNCMFYGDITSGTNKSPVYGGENINNLQGGLNTFNYYAYEKLPTSHITSGKYNCALAVEDKYLNRFEFYRLLLNSNKKLAAFYATGSHDNANEMAKWVLETADRTIDNPKPYPVLKAQGYYPSIINPDIEHAPDSASVGRNHGGKLGKELSVTISMPDVPTGGIGKPSGASLTKTSLSLQRTDKDFDRFNYNYDKVQLPYYNDVGTDNYTNNRVVTGWMITEITEVANDPYTSANYPTTGITDYPNHNYADRKSSNKDLYSVSKRVFSQGAYFDVPYGVTSITLEPYWGKACYIADENYDVVYKNDYSGKQFVTQTGTQVNVGTTKFKGQNVQKSIEPSLTYITNSLGGLGPTVYDNALVLVGNLHLDGVPLNGNRPFTMMSVDEDNDHEPDYSLIYHHKGRTNITPIRFDFLTVPGTAQAQKPNGASLICNFTIFKTRGWFEVTNTAFMYSSQIEYENGELGTGVTKMDAPLILLGGVFDQFVSTQSSVVNGHTIYIHVGGNVWINSFGLGTHSDGKQSTPHVPVSVTGGDFEEFYLTGTYNANSYIRDDNAECYISGGRFGEVAGASLEQIGNDNTTKGNVHWQIYNADITNFFGGGINDAKPVKGNITTDIFNSNVTLFCGGPKFGDMASGKKVTTNAEGCVFGTYFGAGYGGTSIAKKKYYDASSYNWSTLQGYYTTDRGKYFDGTSTGSSQISGKDYGKKGPGVATDFDYEFFVWSTGTTGARLFVKFASFSLAQCNDVESKLKGCTIETNFYGGGNLGKVVGTVTSELDGCTVKENVFGAGFSASLPTLEVRKAGFTKAPNYNSASGMFEPGEFSGTDTFQWQNVSTYPGDGAIGFGDGTNLVTNVTNGTHVVTTINLETSNLGSVNGDVNLTLKGNTTVGTLEGEEGTQTLKDKTGNVYGGGESSYVTGASHKVTVNIKGNTTVLGNVFGGGDRGEVEGSTKVNIEYEESNNDGN